MNRCKHIRYKKLIYDCCDWQNEADKELIIKADYVLCASKILFDKVKDLIVNSGYALVSKCGGSKVVYIPNACDFDHFSKTGEAGVILGKKLPDPIVGYMGCIHPVMVDENIVNALADKFKVMMIGQNKGIQFDEQKIHCTGHIPYNDLPGVLTAATVAIIPFKTDSDYLRHSAPIKVYEYLCAGRPVVASPIPELIPLAEQGLIQIVANDDLEGWVQAVEFAMKEYPNVKGIEWAKQQTWKHRWETIKQEVLNNG
jgi:glycosyltransferase involved in cell wall biosynthesis